MATRTINIRNITDAAPDPTMMKAVLAHCEQHLIGGYKIDITVNPRVPLDAPPHRHPGWLMYDIAVFYNSLAPLRQTAMQRADGAVIEFHNDREYN